MYDHSITYNDIRGGIYRLHCSYILDVVSIKTKELKALPMSDVLLGLMIPLGRRWKSYSFPSTTTVCPALLPPYRIKEG